MGRLNGWSVTLRRDLQSHPWGIRLSGGCDLNKPIIVTRAAAGSPADGLLKPGDEILQIADYDARDIRHQDAQALFKNAGLSIKLVIYRENASILPSRDYSLEPAALPRAPSILPEHQNDVIAPLLFNTALLDTSRSSSRASTHRQEVEEEIHALADQNTPQLMESRSATLVGSVGEDSCTASTPEDMATIAGHKYQHQMDPSDSTLLWPYRTTPLVLPGAKVKKDFGPTESYLRHHPNPMFRQAPPHPLLPHDIAMKQKAVHRQFNSPIGLYSEQNIVDTINQQTGAGASGTPSPVLTRPNPRLSHKKTVVYDPAKSETYKVLQDQELGEHVQEVTPIAPKVFSPVKKTPPATATPTRHSVPRPQGTSRSPHPVPGPQGNVNSVGHIDEIQQSYTFKRLMHMVQSEGVY